MRQTTGLYAVLGVAPDSDPIVIDAAYRALMKKYHPDRFEGHAELAERKAKQLNAAYAILRDPQGRRQHDDALKASSDPEIGWDWRYRAYGGAPAAAGSSGWQAAATMPRGTDRGILRQGAKMLAGTVGILLTGVWLILSEGNATPALSALAFAPASPHPIEPRSPMASLTGGAGTPLSAIPARLHGDWAFDKSKCGPVASERAHVTANRIDFWTSSGRVDRVIPVGGGRVFQAELNMAGEDGAWKTHVDLRLSPDGSKLRLSDDSGFDHLYVRCPAQA